jgi:hypothetical protein
VKKNAITCVLCGLRPYLDRVDAAPYTPNLFLHEFGGNRRMSWRPLDDPVLGEEVRKKLIGSLKRCLQALESVEERPESPWKVGAKTLALEASAVTGGFFTGTISNMITGHDALKDLVTLLAALGIDLAGHQVGGLRGEVLSSASHGMDGAVGKHLSDRYVTPRILSSASPQASSRSTQEVPYLSFSSIPYPSVYTSSHTTRLLQGRVDRVQAPKADILF